MREPDEQPIPDLDVEGQLLHDIEPEDDANLVGSVLGLLALLAVYWVQEPEGEAALNLNDRAEEGITVATSTLTASAI